MVDKCLFRLFAKILVNTLRLQTRRAMGRYDVSSSFFRIKEMFAAYNDTGNFLLLVTL